MNNIRHEVMLPRTDTGPTTHEDTGPVHTDPATGMTVVQPDAGPSGRGLSAVIWGTLLSLTVAVCWAAYAEVDQVTRGLGAIIASQKTQVVQAPEGGVIQELLVREGDAVRAGQVLARLDASLGEVMARQASLQAAIVRLKAELLGHALTFPPSLQAFPDIIQAQRRLHAHRTSALQSELDALTASLRLAEEELVLNERLLASGDVSRTEVIRLRRQANDIRSQINNRRNKFLQDAQTELAKAEDELATVTQTVTQRQSVLAQTQLVAPVKGVVRNVRFTTVGAVLRTGDELMSIVPTADTLIVEAKIRPSDIAFIQTGMPANIKVDAYDSAIFGALNGRVTYISPDTLTEEGSRPGAEGATFYRVHVETEDRTFKKRPQQAMELIPGMTATVEIKTGQNNVLRYLMKPLTKTLDESLGER